MNGNRNRAFKDAKVRTALNCYFDLGQLKELREVYTGNLSALLRELLSEYINKKKNSEVKTDERS